MQVHPLNRTESFVWSSPPASAVKPCQFQNSPGGRLLLRVHQQLRSGVLQDTASPVPVAECR